MGLQITYKIFCFSRDSIRQWSVQSKTSSGQRLSSRTSKSIFPHEDFPPERCKEWRNLRQHAQEGLEARSRNQTYIAGKCYSNDNFTLCCFNLKCLQ